MISPGRFHEALRNIPAPGGNGCHPYLLKLANYGIKEGYTPQDLFALIRSAIPDGARRVTDREIMDAIAKAGDDRTIPCPHTNRVGVGACLPRRSPVAFDAKQFMKDRLAEGAGLSEADIWDASPIRMHGSPEDDAPLLLNTLYNPDDIIFIGERYDCTVLPVREWLGKIAMHQPLAAHIIPNPLTGRPGKTKDGKDSLRADSCVADFRYAVVEFDSIPRADQVAFWLTVNLPIVALIDSGGKSIHGWIKAGCASADDWTANVENRLYRDFLTPLGVDSSCRNEARLSRMPGVYRHEKARWQRLLYLNPGGSSKPLCRH